MELNLKLPEVFTDIPIEEVRLGEYSYKSGIYIFMDGNDTPLYVGKTGNFGNRMKEHARKSSFFRFSSYVRVYDVYDEYIKDIFETFLINELKPEYNLAKTYYMQDDYDEMLDEIEERINELEDYAMSLKDIIEPFDYESVYGIYIEEEHDEYEDIYDRQEVAHAEIELAEVEYEISNLQKRKRNITLRKSG